MGEPCATETRLGFEHDKTHCPALLGQVEGRADAGDSCPNDEHVEALDRLQLVTYRAHSTLPNLVDRPGHGGRQRLRRRNFGRLGCLRDCIDSPPPGLDASEMRGLGRFAEARHEKLRTGFRA